MLRHSVSLESLPPPDPYFAPVHPLELQRHPDETIQAHAERVARDCRLVAANLNGRPSSTHVLAQRGTEIINSLVSYDFSAMKRRRVAHNPWAWFEKREGETPYEYKTRILREFERNPRLHQVFTLHRRRSADGTRYVYLRLRFDSLSAAEEAADPVWLTSSGPNALHPEDLQEIRDYIARLKNDPTLRRWSKLENFCHQKPDETVSYQFLRLNMLNEMAKQIGVALFTSIALISAHGFHVHRLEILPAWE